VSKSTSFPAAEVDQSRDSTSLLVPPRAVLTDFGGVLTSSVLSAFETVSTAISGDPDFLTRVFRVDDRAGRLLTAHECGRISETQFEDEMTGRLRAHGARTPFGGIAAAINAQLVPDKEMFAVIRRLRSAGVPVAIVSNSFGDACYDGYDLESVADHVVLSRAVGVRKPSRRIYAIACRRLRVDPRCVVMIDDLQHNLVGAQRLGIRGLHHTSSVSTIETLHEVFLEPRRAGEARRQPRHRGPRATTVQMARSLRG
jgi:putative hydrolase of the HAD superfamily